MGKEGRGDFPGPGAQGRLVVPRLVFVTWHWLLNPGQKQTSSPFCVTSCVVGAPCPGWGWSPPTPWPALPPAQAGSALRCRCQDCPAISRLGDLDFCLGIFLEADCFLFALCPSTCFSQSPSGKGTRPGACPFPPWTHTLLPLRVGPGWHVGWGGHWDRLGPSLGPEWIRELQTPEGTLESCNQAAQPQRRQESQTAHVPHPAP